MAATYKKIQTVTVGAGGSSSISFTSIPQTYSDLKIVLSARSANASNLDNPRFTINSSTSSFYRRELYAESGSVGSETVSDRLIGNVPGANLTSSTFGNLKVIIPNYTGTNYKSYSVDSVSENNGSTNSIWILAGLWAVASPITGITITLNSASNFVQYSTATLYGIFNTNVSGAPSAPTIGTVTTNGLTASVPFTPNGQTASLYTVTSNTGGFTATGTSSPISVSGLTDGQSYTFTVTAANPLGTATSAVSNSVTAIGVYTLAQTYTSSTTYTVPAGKSKIAVFLSAAGGGAAGGGFGRSGSVTSGAGGGGGGAGGALAFKDYPVTPGQTYTITIGTEGNGGAAATGQFTGSTAGGTGGSTSFGSLVTVSGGTGAPSIQVHLPSPAKGLGGTVTTNNVASYLVSTSTGIDGGDPGDGVETGTSNGNPGSNGGSSSTLSTTLAGIGTVTYTHGGGGAGGGSGARNTSATNSLDGGAGGSGGSSYGGSGGTGADEGSATASSAATGRGGGGGGGGGGRTWGTSPTTTGGSAGSAGFRGEVVIYEY